MTEDIVTGLSRFSYLKVIARSATSRYTNDAIDLHSAAKELGARYVMEGTLRQAGSKLRIVVQLVDAATGAHLWAETYVHPFNPEALFELQDELVPRIVSTVADTRGVLPHTMSEALRNRASDQLTPYEALLRSFAYFQRINAEEHGIVRAALERAVKQAPGFAVDDLRRRVNSRLQSSAVSLGTCLPITIPITRWPPFYFSAVNRKASGTRLSERLA